MRGSAEYKRALVAALVKRAIAVAVQRARGEHVEVSQFMPETVEKVAIQ